MKKRRAMNLLLVAVLVWGGLLARAADTNSLVWNAGRDQVSADIHSEALWPLLEDIAHQTGWHIFVEPSASHTASVKFKNLPSGEALEKLLGNLNYAFVPQTNGPQQLYVFTTTIQNATRRVKPPRAEPKVTAMKHVGNQLLVKLKPGANIDALAKERHARVVARNDKLGIYLLQFDDSAATDSALAGLQADPDVAAVSYNYIFDPPVTPQPVANVPPGAGPVSLTLNPSSSGNPCDPIVGLIDTGMQSLGSDLNQFVMPGTNVTGEVPDLSSTTPTHATAMAQTILRAVSQQGGSSSVRILPVNVYGSGETATTWNVALGVQAAVDGGATVLNMSLAGSSDDAVLDSIIQQAVAKGIVIFAAAGNQPVSTPNYPAAIPGVNAVTALSGPGQLASYANYGSFVQMALPGSSLVYLGNQAFVVQGTSAATAYASGIAAGNKAVNCQPWSQIENAMDQQFPVPTGD
ncbi:MAG TPA: S8 family serine peptidase [Candidatus Acidoferrales bacterium]|nr:S8 family serine peptidase [Candidatus Acidoferrales bacterium]